MLWMLAGLLGCPYVQQETVRDVDGDGIDALRFGGRDCDDQDPEVGDCDVDRDGEQALGFGTDCDDTLASVGANQPERCDGIDNDCDGLIDDDDDGEILGRSEFFADDDGDGYGAGDAILVCEAPAGFVARAGDCNDAFAGIHPGEPEQCDGVDWNCDGDPLLGAVVQWFTDADGDGFGDPGLPLAEGCDQPPDSASNPFDCDDGDALAHPTGTVTPDATERCDGIDNDCDGLTDGDDPGLDPAEARAMFRDADGDGFGDPLLGTERCPADAGFVENALDCDDADPDVHPNAQETCEPGDEDCDGLEDSDDPDNDGVLWYPDLDGDGIGVEAGARPVCEVSGLPGLVPTFGDCDDTDGTITADVLWYVDADGDGFGRDDASTDLDDPVASCFPVAGRSRLATDCDDVEPAIRPGAAELCNGLDDDCDGVIDEGAPGTTFGFRDADGDGYGDPQDPPGSYCVGTASNALDCDDSDATIRPFSTEICDGIDNDCDALVDEQDPGLVPDRFYRDADLDGFGDPASVVTGCTGPATFIRKGGDCDDTNPAQYFDLYFVTDTENGPQRRPSIAAALAHPGRCVNAPLELVLEIDQTLPDALHVVSPAVVGMSGLTVRGDGSLPRLTVPAAGPRVAGTLALEGLTLRVQGTGAAIQAFGPGPVVTLTDIDLEDFDGVLVQADVTTGPPDGLTGPTNAPVGLADVTVELTEVRVGAELGGLVQIEGAAADVLLDRVTWLDGESFGPLLALDVVAPTAAGFDNRVRVLDSRFDGVSFGGPLLDGRNGVHAAIERTVFAGVDVVGPLLCLEGTTCSGEASDLPVPTSTPGSVVLRNDHFVDVVGPAGVPWLLWQPSTAQSTSIGTTFADAPLDAPVVTFVPGDPNAEPSWTSLRDRFVRVGGGFELDDGHLRFYESQLVEVDWPGLGGSRATLTLQDSAFIATSAPITAEEVHASRVVHVGGTWPWPDPLVFPATSMLDGLFHFPDVGPPSDCAPACQSLDPAATAMVSWSPSLAPERMIPYPRVSTSTTPAFRFGSTLIPGQEPTLGVLWEQDPNEDDLPSAWIVFHASTPECVPIVPQVVDPDANPDGDGRDNVEEYDAGTWPCIAD